jgi:digeranylgeranylglycerophospholipid reductase
MRRTRRWRAIRRKPPGDPMTQVAQKFDIVVVGAGPAGSSAALAAASAGLRVLVVDRKAVPGLPVRCAEHIPALLLGQLPCKKDFIVQSVEGMRTHLPDGQVTQTKAPGFIIARDRFDQALLEAAADAGAQVSCGTRAIARHAEGIVLQRASEPAGKIKARIIIGADGPHSTVGRWIGSVNTHLIPALQVRVPLRNPSAYTEIYFDPAFVGAYGWLFPRDRYANVGLGICKNGRRMPPLVKTLDMFIDRLAVAGKVQADPVQRHFGWIPAEKLRPVTAGNILLAGDAAGQTHAITGGGVPQAVICGRMAGQWAARAAQANDLQLLDHYETEWRDLFADTLTRAHQKRLLLEARWEQLNDIIRSCWIAYRGYYETAA